MYRFRAPGVHGLICTLLSLSAALVLLLGGTRQAVAEDFIVWDLTELNYIPPSLTEKGYRRMKMFRVCHFWRIDYDPGNPNKNGCDSANFEKVNKKAVKHLAKQTLGEEIVAFDIERLVGFPGTDVWDLHAKDPDDLEVVIDNWLKLIAEFRKTNPDTRILVYGAMGKIWWQLVKNNRYPLINAGNAEIERRAEQGRQLARLFEDPSVVNWPSAYWYTTLEEDDIVNIMREQGQWQIDICKNVQKTKCYFAMAPMAMGKARGPDGDRYWLPTDTLFEQYQQLYEDGADGLAFWTYYRYNNNEYFDLMREWEANRGNPDYVSPKEVAWLDLIERVLDDLNSKQAQPAVAAEVARPAD